MARHARGLPDRRRRWLHAEALDGSDQVSFNHYALTSGPALRPCEMPGQKVVAFVLGYGRERGSGNDWSAHQS